MSQREVNVTRTESIGGRPANGFTCEEVGPRWQGLRLVLDQKNQVQLSGYFHLENDAVRRN